MLRVFTSLIGLRDVGLELEDMLNAIQRPIGNISRLGRFFSRTVGNYLMGPEVTTRSSELEPDCRGWHMTSRHSAEISSTCCERISVK